MLLNLSVLRLCSQQPRKRQMRFSGVILRDLLDQLTYDLKFAKDFWNMKRLLIEAPVSYPERYSHPGTLVVFSVQDTLYRDSL